MCIYGSALWRLIPQSPLPAPGHVRGQRVPAKFFADPKLLSLVVGELETASSGFTAAVTQLCNVATLPGIVGASIGMPDIHSGYGFAIGNVAAFDMDGEGVVSPGGVGFDINCGVRVLRTNLREGDLPAAARARLADRLFELIPVGVGEAGAVELTKHDLDAVLGEGMGWTERRGISWPEDREVCEERGCFAGADPAQVSDRAKKRGVVQLGSLGSGNHYTEIQVVDEIYDKEAAAVMGIQERGQVMVMIHTGSRGLGHQAIGQPVLIGGSMGTASYIRTGTHTAMKESFGSTCHGAGRAMSCSAAVKTIDSTAVLSQLERRGIQVRVATRHLAAEEAPESYKGFGDLFVVRVAGNVTSEHVLGSISYALQNLGARLVLVMGHTKCGAVKAAVAEFVEQARQRAPAQDSGSEAGAGEPLRPTGSDASSELGSISIGASPPSSGNPSFDLPRLLPSAVRPLAQALAPLTDSTGGGGGGGGGGGKGGGGGARGPGLRGLVQRVVGLLGGREATEKLVHTASFRDLEHLDKSTKSSPPYCRRSNRHVVWEVLGGERGTPTPGGASPGPGSPRPAGPAPPRPEAAHVPSVAEAAHAVVAAHEAAARAAKQAAAGGAGSGGVGGAGDAPQVGESPRFQPHQGGGSTLYRPSLTGVVEKIGQPLLVRPEVCSEALHQRLERSVAPGDLCLDTHILNCSNVLRECAYQNVRQQCNSVWTAVQRYLAGPASEELLVAQALYDLDTGVVDFFGLHG
ncbi:tRNA-splicing ligase-like protein [Micractinium conductrix]|uniref:3'-phosphate/5'-hydroxy nucleic acid ligase n=1 Tax=Micractinium conductrix TaxID=554055 RepID=A0A2P6V767_9CHLO|nr:tRNA-splicing ligase-like protein [Micractinium conductrix]|eukprot:PSC69934.1 tRNA-splicing ligase-like protein [Micractinium conductrix]